MLYVLQTTAGTHWVRGWAGRFGEDNFLPLLGFEAGIVQLLRVVAIPTISMRIHLTLKAGFPRPSVLPQSCHEYAKSAEQNTDRIAEFRD
jgi:hypothetical protein